MYDFGIAKYKADQEDPTRLVRIYSDATRVAQTLGQMVGENGDYYVTLQQLEAIVKTYQE